MVVSDKISGIAARFVHLAATEAALDKPLADKLAALLTYGDPYARPVRQGPDASWSAPVSAPCQPWASKATDIAHNCGLAVKRVERLVEYRLDLEERPV